MVGPVSAQGRGAELGLPRLGARDTEARDTLREIIDKANKPAVEGFRDAVQQAGASTRDGKGMWADSSFEDLVQYNDGFRTQLIGTPEQIAERIVAYRDLGVDLILGGFLHFQEEIEYFGAKVLPLVRELHFGRVLTGARIANAQSERAGATVAEIATTLKPVGPDGGADAEFRIDGTKFYCTGALFADVLAVLTRLDDPGESSGLAPGDYIAFLPADTAGVETVDHQVVLVRITRLAARSQHEPLVFHGSRFRRLHPGTGPASAEVA